MLYPYKVSFVVVVVAAVVLLIAKYTVAVSDFCTDHNLTNGWWVSIVALLALRLVFTSDGVGVGVRRNQLRRT